MIDHPKPPSLALSLTEVPLSGLEASRLLLLQADKTAPKGEGSQCLPCRDMVEEMVRMPILRLLSLWC